VRHAGEDHWVGVTLKETDNAAVIEVSDHGSGIAEKDIERIWERYYTNRQRRGKGVSGLGLAIVKQTAALHHGRCEVDSEVGKGSTFRMILDTNADA
jgi:signal transduction histidine kinase